MLEHSNVLFGGKTDKLVSHIGFNLQAYPGGRNNSVTIDYEKYALHSAYKHITMIIFEDS